MVVPNLATVKRVKYDPFIFSEKQPCSRPLGMCFDAKGNRILTADAYLGVYEVKQQTGEFGYLHNLACQRHTTLIKWVKHEQFDIKEKSINGPSQMKTKHPESCK